MLTVYSPDYPHDGYVATIDGSPFDHWADCPLRAAYFALCGANGSKVDDTPFSYTRECAVK